MAAPSGGRRSWLSGLGATIISAIAIAAPANAAFEFTAVGARAGGMGDACSAVATGAEGLFWNPASVAWKPGFSVSAGKDRPFGMVELDTESLAVAWCGSRIGVGLGITSFGPEIYREISASAVVGWRVSHRATLGTAVRRLSVRVSDLGRREWFVFDLGACATLGRRAKMSLWARNAGGTATDVIAQGGSLGISGRVSGRVLLSAELLKEADLPAGLGIGLELSAGRGVWLRAGAGGEPERTSLGFGLAKGPWTLDYAAIYHTVLGLSHRVSVTVRLHRGDPRTKSASGG